MSGVSKAECMHWPCRWPNFSKRKAAHYALTRMSCPSIPTLTGSPVSLCGPAKSSWRIRSFSTGTRVPWHWGFWAMARSQPRRSQPNARAVILRMSGALRRRLLTFRLSITTSSSATRPRTNLQISPLAASRPSRRYTSALKIAGKAQGRQRMSALKSS